jgi:hypothetical protein
MPTGMPHYNQSTAKVGVKHQAINQSSQPGRKLFFCKKLMGEQF